MKNTIIKIVLIILAISAVYAGVFSMRGRSVPMKNLIEVSSASEGNSIVSWYEGDKTIIAKVTNTGKVDRYITYNTLDKKHLYTIRGISAGNQGTVYLLRDVKDPYDGSLKEQQLVVYDFGGWFAREKKVFTLNQTEEITSEEEITSGEENYNYGWINVSGETITLIATDMYEETAIRRSYEYGALLSGTLNIKSTRTYPLAGEGIYQAVGNSTDLVYISDSGKIFRADEEEVREVFPARTLDTLMYPTFLTYAESGFVYFGEKESGNIIKLNLEDGAEEIVMPGGAALNGASIYTPKDIVKMSMQNLNVYSAVIYNDQTKTYHILAANEGKTYTITSMKYSVLSVLGKFILYLAAAFFTISGVLLAGYVIITGIRKGKTIMGRLIFISTPLLMAAMGFFGLIAYNYYREAIEENFVKQTVDEGNMLTAVFGQESFNEIEYPYDYTGEAYTYLNKQLATRDLYTRVLYYEGDELYVGVDKESPCFYPLDIWMNGDAKEFYKQAALTGNSATGYVEDRMGKRLVSITPVGGVSGQTVYLMETGIFVSNIDKYMSSYIQNFATICVAFFIIIIVLLAISFYKILSPIQTMKLHMGDFIEGDPESRIIVESEDELAILSRIFNKMADDTIVQRHNLEKITSTYYRFIPGQMFKMLKIDSLGDLKAGSHIEGEFVLMWAALNLNPNLAKEEVEEYSNLFFSILNGFAVKNDVILISGQADLQNLVLLCRKGVDVAINTALSVLAKIDAQNAGVQEHQMMKVCFIIHNSEADFRICGDEERYIPALFAPELSKLLQKKEFLQSLGSRILLTGQAYSEIYKKERYANRYIGNVAVNHLAFSIYDIYDDKSAAEIKSMKNTEDDFSRAMSLFEEGAYYQAKNLFTRVLRYNLNDMVAKHYIFECDTLQKSN